jgi:hypothetical protein
MLTRRRLSHGQVVPEGWLDRGAAHVAALKRDTMMDIETDRATIDRTRLLRAPRPACPAPVPNGSCVSVHDEYVFVHNESMMSMSV